MAKVQRKTANSKFLDDLISHLTYKLLELRTTNSFWIKQFKTDFRQRKKWNRDMQNDEENDFPPSSIIPLPP